MRKPFTSAIAVFALVISLFPVSTKADSQNPEVYHLYNSATKAHLYTTDTNEVNTLTPSATWSNEGVSWYSPAFGTPVYRLRNNAGLHHYTSSENEIKDLTTKYGWDMDNGGQPMFFSGGDFDVYRLFNASTGQHLFTPYRDVYDNYSASGWTAEGVAYKATGFPEKTTNSKIVCIDPGHQRRGDSAKEPNGPGSSVTKARVTQGTTGRATGVPEYVMNLEVSLMLRDELIKRGYEVVMTRETHDVNISNKERAELATRAGADITVRIHGNGSDNTSIKGALCMVPTGVNPYVSDLSSESRRLGEDIVNSYCAATGMVNKGIQATDTMTGINFSTMPVCILEMGFMSNSQDDTNMQNSEFRKKMVAGIADGIDKYFTVPVP